MKRILLSILVMGVLLFGACASPTTAPGAEAPATAPPTEQTATPEESEPIPTSTPSVGLSRNNPLPMGESLVTPEDIEITVLNSTKGDQAWEIIQKANQFNDPPANGMQYILITVKVKNISSQKEPWAYTDLYFELVGSSNKVFHTFDKSAVLPDEGMLSKLRAELYHGGEATGSLSFYIPQNETNLVLTWRGLIETSRRFFEVKSGDSSLSTPTPTPTPTSITSKAGLQSFLEENFATLNTSLGLTHFTFYVDYNDTINYPYDYWIQVEYDFNFFYDLKYSNKISTEMNNRVADELRAHQERLARAVIEKMPNTKLMGGYHYSWYTYPNIKVDLNVRRYYSWVNYAPASFLTKYEDAKITGFTWYSVLDDTLLR